MSRNLRGNRCSEYVSSLHEGLQQAKFRKIPSNYPVTREFGIGDRFRRTASTTIQSYQTADFQTESKQAVSVGISAAIVLLFQSPGTLPVSRADFSLPVSASKNSVPRSRVAAAKAVWELGNLGSFSGQKRTFRVRSVLIEGSIRGLRTAGSILAEHREVARRRCRVATDLPRRPARDLARETRVRSSC